MGTSFIADLIEEKGLEGLNRFYSIYRGRVVDNVDPQNQGRLLINIPSIVGGQSVTFWAYPKGYHQGKGYGVKLFTPKINEIVYVVFEQGDVSKPLWEPHGWARGEIPTDLADNLAGGIVTPNGNIIRYSDEDDSLYIIFKGRISIISKDYQYIQADKAVIIEGDDGVVINGGNNEGLVNIRQLTEKLNQLVSEINSLKAQLAAHTHTGNMGEPTSAPITPIDQKFSQFNQSDYEDTKVLH